MNFGGAFRMYSQVDIRITAFEDGVANHLPPALSCDVGSKLNFYQSVRKHICPRLPPICALGDLIPNLVEVRVDASARTDKTDRQTWWASM